MGVLAVVLFAVGCGSSSEVGEEQAAAVSGGGSGSIAESACVEASEISDLSGQAVVLEAVVLDGILYCSYPSEEAEGFYNDVRVWTEPQYLASDLDAEQLTTEDLTLPSGETLIPRQLADGLIELRGSTFCWVNSQFVVSSVGENARVGGAGVVDEACRVAEATVREFLRQDPGRIEAAFEPPASVDWTISLQPEKLPGRLDGERLDWDLTAFFGSNPEPVTFLETVKSYAASVTFRPAADEFAAEGERLLIAESPNSNPVGLGDIALTATIVVEEEWPRADTPEISESVGQSDYCSSGYEGGVINESVRIRGSEGVACNFGDEEAPGAVVSWVENGQNFAVTITINICALEDCDADPDLLDLTEPLISSPRALIDELLRAVETWTPLPA